MTEDDQGIIWGGTHPGGNVVRYDPHKKEFREYERIYDHDAESFFPRAIAADDQGWIYVGISYAAGQIVILDPETGDTTPVIPREEVTGDGHISLYRDLNGRVYGQSQAGEWYELYDGKAERLESRPRIEEKPIIAGWQNLRHNEFPGGRRIQELEIESIQPRLVVYDPRDKEETEFEFDVSAGSATPMDLTHFPDGTIGGGTYIPHQFFAFNPKTDEWKRTDGYGQWNTTAATENAVYAGIYPFGELARYDPEKEWGPENPEVIAKAPASDIHRPYELLIHSNGRHVILTGEADYGYTGGGLLIWDRKEEEYEVFSHNQLLKYQDINSLVELPDGNLFGGTSVVPISGGKVQKVEEAELFIYDVHKREVIWREVVLDGKRYSDMTIDEESGKIFAVLDREHLVVFDPENKELIHKADLEENAANQQGPKIIEQIPDGRIFLLFHSGKIAEVNRETYEVNIKAEAPRVIRNGFVYDDGRIYFGTQTRLLSWEVPESE